MWVTAILVAACSIPFLGGMLFAADASVRMSVEFFQADSARVIARWAPGRDAKGATDAYSVRWTSGSASRAVLKTATADTFNVMRPAFNDSALVTVAVVGMRRGVLSADTVRASLWVKNPDSRPPGIDSLKIDTLSVDLAMSKFMSDSAITVATLAGRVIPYDTSAMWVPSVMRHVADSSTALTGRDTVITMASGPSWQSAMCAVYRNDAQKEYYPSAWYLVAGDSVAHYAPHCSTTAAGWMPRLYGKYYPGYAMREVPGDVDQRNLPALHTAMLSRPGRVIREERRALVAVGGDG